MPDSILILDTSVDNSEEITQFLRNNGYAAKVETEPESILTTLENKDYLLIINDIFGQLIEKYNILEKVRTRFPEIPIILVTNQKKPSKLAKIGNIGVSLILEAAYDPDLLLESIRENTNISDGQIEEVHKSNDAEQINYPTPKHLASASPGDKKRIQALYRTFQKSNHIFIVSHHGAELELILKEVGEWSGYPNKRNIWVQAEQLDTPETKQTLNQLFSQETFGPVIGIDNLSTASDAIQEQLLNFIKVNYKKIKQGSSLTFIYHIDHGTLDKLTKEFRKHIKPYTINIPPLNKRLADLVTYIQGYLEKKAIQEKWPNRVEWTSKAIGAMLNYEWPNDYTELINFLRKVARLADKSLIDAATVCQLLNIDLKVHDHYAQLLSLDAFLIKSQNELLKEESEKSKESLEEILKKIKADFNKPEADLNPDNMPFLYPSLTGK